MATQQQQRTGDVSFTYNGNTHMLSIRGRIDQVRQAINELGSQPLNATNGSPAAPPKTAHRKKLSAETRKKLSVAAKRNARERKAKAAAAGSKH